jgi:hypothetical protein
MEIKKSNKIVGFDINISGNMVGMNISYSITNLGTELDPTATKLYDSELKSSKKSANNISFIRCNIPIMFLNTGKNSSNNISIDFRCKTQIEFG